MGRGKKSSDLGSGVFRKKGVFSVITLLAALFIVTICVGFVWLRSNTNRAETTLRFVSVVHRHGERAPEWTYPLDPYKGEKFWPEGLGSLLHKGKWSLFELGKFLRHRYDGFLSPEYKSAETLMISSFFDRCLMSAELLLAGLYPPMGSQLWNADLLWQPVPVHSVPSFADDMIRVSKPCAALSKEYKYVTTNFFQKKLDEIPDLLAYLSQKTGLKIENLSQIQKIFDYLQIVEQQGYALPEWTRDVYPDKLKPLVDVYMLDTLYTPSMTKLLSGVFINDILSNMNKKASSTHTFERRLNLYSAHDRNIVRFWRGMNITQELVDIPYYGAAFIIELHEIMGNYRVKILYKKGSFNNDLTVLKIRGCENDPAIRYDGMCDFNIFSSVLQSVAITNFEKECQLTEYV